jgi:microcompartment protein CcmK/EutM
VRICRVVGPVVSTAKHPAYVGHKLLCVQPVDERGAAQGSSFLAVDTVDGGEGDRVLVNSEGNSARQIIGGDKLPMRSLVVGVVDRVDTSPGA